jgi:hypothetical protein
MTYNVHVGGVTVQVREDPKEEEKPMASETKKKDEVKPAEVKKAKTVKECPPNVPLLVALSDKIEFLYHADYIYTLLPKLRKYILDLPVTDDGQAKLPLTVDMKTWVAILAKADFDRFDPWYYRDYTNYLVAPGTQTFISSISRPMDPPQRVITQGIEAMQDIICNSKEGRFPTQKQAKDVFKVCSHGPEGSYVIGKVTHESQPCTLHKNAIMFVECRFSDIQNFFVLRVELPQLASNCKWKDNMLESLFDSIEYIAGGQTFNKLDWRTNCMLAKAKNLWPTIMNSVKDKTDHQWVATIPIMFDQTIYPHDVVDPMIATYWHETRLVLHGFKEDLNAFVTPASAAPVKAKYYLDIDGNYFGNAMRAYIANGANGTDKPDVPQLQLTDKDKQEPTTIPVSFSRDPEMSSEWRKLDDSLQPEIKAKPVNIDRDNRAITRKYGTIPFTIGKDDDTVTINLNKDYSIACSGIILSFTTPMAEDVPQGFLDDPAHSPIVSAKVCINSRVYLFADLVELSEFNWLKCGLKRPEPLSYLIPFSADLFPKDAVMPAVTADLCRMDNSTLVLTVNKSSRPLHWQGIVSTICFNSQRFATGMIAQKYTQ